MKLSTLTPRVMNVPGMPMTFILIAAIVVFQVLNPIFLSPGTVYNFLTNAAPILLLTLGVAVVIIGGGIDLSVGTVAGLSAGTTMLALVSGAPLWAGVGVGASTGLLFGLINGVLVAILRIDDFIATLATLNIAAGLLVVLSQATLLQGVSTPGFAEITRVDVLGVPISFLIAAGLFFDRPPSPVQDRHRAQTLCDRRVG